MHDGVFILFFLKPEPKFHGTLKPADNFNPEKDAEALRKAMQGSGEKNILLKGGLQACKAQAILSTWSPEMRALTYLT